MGSTCHGSRRAAPTIGPMSDEGLQQARDKMAADDVDPMAIEVFSHYYRLVESGETGMIREADIEPLDMDALADVEVADDEAVAALGRTVVVKLNGGLGTSMGLAAAKTLLEVRDGLTFLDVIARQVLALRERHDVRLPLLFMNSFRTRDDTLEALGGVRRTCPTPTCRWTSCRTRSPSCWPRTSPRSAGPTTRPWSGARPGHGDLYTALRGTGLLDAMIEAGFTQVFVSNSDNLGAVPDPRVAGWFAASGAPFAIEAVRRTPSDRKGGHFARRTSDDRIVLRETAQTAEEDKEALADLDRHRFTSTNNLWFDLAAMKQALDERDGILGLAMIRNTKTVDPSDSSTPEVVQIETAMGAAIEVFEGATTIEVGRDRFVPVKTTNDLLVLRSDCYRLDDDAVLEQVVEEIPFVDLGSAYKLVGGFEERFPSGVPSLREATRFEVPGDWTFGADVTAVGRGRGRRRGLLRRDRRRHARWTDTGVRAWSGPAGPVRVLPMAFVPSSDQPSVSVEEHVERILSSLEPLAAVAAEPAGLAGAARSPRPSRRRWTCRPSTTAGWTATRSSTPTWPEPPRSSPSRCRWPASPPPAGPPSSRCRRARRSRS